MEFERVLVRGGNNHWALFRTPDDRHGWVRLVPPYEVDWTDVAWGSRHWSSCPDEVKAAERHG